MMVWIAVSGVVSAGISVLVSFLLMRKYSKALGGLLQTYVGGIEEEINEIRPTISKAYGILANMGTTPKQLKTAEKYIAQDIVETNTNLRMALGVLETVSPRGAEYLRENPDILPEIIEKWWPKIQAITGAGSIEDLVSMDGIKKPERRSIAWGQQS